MDADRRDSYNVNKIIKKRGIGELTIWTVCINYLAYLKRNPHTKTHNVRLTIRIFHWKWMNSRENKPEQNKNEETFRWNECAMSQMSVAHCSVNRIAHNFRFLVICSGCCILPNVTDITQKYETYQTKGKSMVTSSLLSKWKFWTNEH